MDVAEGHIVGRLAVASRGLSNEREIGSAGVGRIPPRPVLVPFSPHLSLPQYPRGCPSVHLEGYLVLCVGHVPWIGVTTAQTG